MGYIIYKRAKDSQPVVGLDFKRLLVLPPYAQSFVIVIIHVIV